MNISAKQRYLAQIGSALYLLLALPYLGVRVYYAPLTQLSDLITFMREADIALPGLITFLLMLVHGWLGLRDIAIDYLPRSRLYLALKVLALSVLFLGAWIVFLTLHLFGGDYGV
ncbi:MAG: hypothetical protein RBS36_05830 [Thiomicrospira sp.]|jgi:succinate dehydrogenase hydrophobic membrane anchor protein|nr:hypothetical protein [Thiomicrospira sp.]